MDEGHYSGRARRNLLRNIGTAAHDLNIKLVIIAIGLALLDLTVLASLKAFDRLPIVVCDGAGKPVN